MNRLLCEHSYKILCIGEMWLGSNARASIMAFHRLGHSTQVIDEYVYHPAPWRSFSMRVIRKILRPLLVRELYREAKRLTNVFRPDAVFVFKGNAVHPDVLRFFNARGIPVVNYYPDVSFLTHGPYIPRTLPLYDHIFTTKSWGMRDMKSQLGIKSISFLEHGYDPDLDGGFEMTKQDRARYNCDVVFIGTWSPKKEILLAHLKHSLPGINLRIWGIYWEKSTSPVLTTSIVGDEILGYEYTKALMSASICLGFLSEARKGASSGDLITSRTFNIPACGAFMLHERNEESIRYFKEDEEAAFFDSPEELVQRVEFYLPKTERRKEIAVNGQRRCVESGYSIDDRMKHVIQWFDNHISK